MRLLLHLEVDTTARVFEVWCDRD